MEDHEYPRYYNFKVLRFVRDNRPTEEELLEFFGHDPERPWDAQGAFAQLRKSGLVVLDGEHWVLRPDRLSDDGRFFRWGNQSFILDEDLIYTY